ncbi:MAG: Ger(x)C family spore germination protein [Tissierella sp.]|uniref:Ger(x)C family spore germination protein n=1 Tax=Tissierella sp. TaxID=41274 RepID=UPI003F9D19CE
MNKLLKLFSAFLLIFLNVFLISCTISNEIDTLGIVVAVGLDVDGDEVVLTNEVINPMDVSSNEGNESQEFARFVISRGRTIQEAMSNASLTFDKKLYYPHAHMIIIGEDLAKNGLDGFADIFSRDNEIRETTFLMIAKNAKAYEVMGINEGQSNSSGKYIYEIAKQDGLNSKHRTLNISDFFKYIYQKNEGQVFGLVEKSTVRKEGENEFREVLSVEGGGVFKEGKLVGYFSGEEIAGFRFIVDEYEQGDIVFRTPKDIIKEKREKKHKHNYTSFRIYKNKTKMDIKLIDDKFHLFIDLKLSGSLKSTQRSIDLNESETINKIEQSIQKNIKGTIGDTLKKAQAELEVDTFSIGRLVYTKYPHIWNDIKEDWTEVFKDLEYTISVDASINDSGFTNKSMSIKKSIYE